MLGPDALAWRDRHYGQSSCPQGRRRARENRGNRRNAAAPTPLFSRSQSDRAVLRKTQSSPAQVLRALHPRPLGSNRNNPPGLHSRRVQQLLHTRRIWAKMRGIRSRSGSLAGTTAERVDRCYLASPPEHSLPMSKFPLFLVGPWRAVAVLGVTQILAWGTMFYTPVLMLPRLAADRGFTATFAMAGFSAGLLVAGFVARYVGILIDGYGGHRVMPAGSLLGALGLVGLTYAADPLAYFAVWTVLGLAMAASLYDPAFASLGRIFGARARRPITALTLAGGFASTVSWPATQALLDALGWRGTYLVYAALLAGIAAPLHALALPRRRAESELRPTGAAEPAPTLFPAKSRAFVLVAAAFAAYAFVPSGLSAHLLAIFARHGIDPATAVMIGALFGPSQVAARICEFAFAR